jgi:hypothetical protein
MSIFATVCVGGNLMRRTQQAQDIFLGLPDYYLPSLLFDQLSPDTVGMGTILPDSLGTRIRLGPEDVLKGPVRQVLKEVHDQDLSTSQSTER